MRGRGFYGSAFYVPVAAGALMIITTMRWRWIWIAGLLYDLLFDILYIFHWRVLILKLALLRYLSRA